MTSTPAQSRTRFPLTGLWWAAFDWARSPFYYVVIIYVFATYFAEHIAGNGTQGQSVVSSIATIAGVLMAIIAPFLGGFMDRGGAKKPVILALMLVLATASMALGFVRPGLSYAIPLAAFLMITASCCYSISELFHNALLPAAGPRQHIPLISGLGLSLGSGASVVVLLALIYLLGHPPFGLTEQDVARLSGVVCGIWILIFMTPFFLGMPDHFKHGATWRHAGFFPQTWTPIKTMRALFDDHPNMMRFLFARMIFMDGLSALFTIGAVYVAGVLGWSPAETATMGIVATLSAVLGGGLGGLLDKTFGPRKAILIELFSITLIFCFQIGLTSDAILFGLIKLDVPGNTTGLFSGPTDIIYLASIIPLSAFIIGAYSSCRSMLMELSPPDKIGQFFGIYAMTSTITVWLGPALVSLATLVSNSQRIGFSSLGILFLAGSVLMFRVEYTHKPARVI